MSEAWLAARLGKESDGAIADQLGVSRHVVRGERARRGVPCCVGKFTPRREIKWDEQGLGTEPDLAIARRLGVACSTVTMHRIGLGIPPFLRTKQESLGPLVDGYLVDCLQRNLAPSTVRAYRYDLRAFFLVTGSAPVPSRRDVETYKDHLTKRALKPASRLRKLITLSAYCSWLEERDLVEMSPVRRKDLRIKLDRRLPRGVEDSRLRTAARVLYRRHDVSSTRDQALFEVLCCTGIRVAELVALDTADLLVSSGVMTIRIQGKGSKERLVALTDAQSIASVQRYVGSLKDSLGPLFRNQCDRRLTTDGVRKIFRKNMPGVTPHMLRHTVATNLIRAGVDIRVIQELLGHSSITTTQVYASVDTSTLVRTLQAHNPRLHFAGGR